jgi:hypothetical protein
MKREYSWWAGVKKLAKELDYSWFDVCEIIWKTKYHKQPSHKELLLFSVIRKNLIQIEKNKQVVDLSGNPVARKEGEKDIHYAIRTDLDYFKQYYVIKKKWSNDPNLYKSLRQKYKLLYKRFAKEINSNALIMG